MAATTNFRIGAAAVVSEPAQPLLAAWPTVEGAAPVVRYPQPTRRTGAGLPAGIVGKPWCEFGRSRVEQTGIAYYQAFFATAADESVAVKTKLYDARSGTWKIYSGIMWRPQVGKALPGSAYRFSDFKVVITELVELAGWNA